MIDARVAVALSSNLLTRNHNLLMAIDAGGDRVPVDAWTRCYRHKRDSAVADTSRYSLRPSIAGKGTG